MIPLSGRLEKATVRLNEVGEDCQFMVAKLTTTV